MQRKMLWKPIITFALVTKRIFAWAYARKNIKGFLTEALITLALCANYTAAFVLVLFLKWESAYFIVIVFGIGLLAGLLFSNLGKCILYVGLSMVAGAAITIVLYLSPLWIYEQTYMINAALEGAFTFMAPYLLFGTLFSLVGSMITSLLSGARR